MLKLKPQILNVCHVIDRAKELLILKQPWTLSEIRIRHEKRTFFFLSFAFVYKVPQRKCLSVYHMLLMAIVSLWLYFMRIKREKKNRNTFASRALWMYMCSSVQWTSSTRLLCVFFPSISSSSFSFSYLLAALCVYVVCVYVLFFRCLFHNIHRFKLQYILTYLVLV